MRFPTKCFFRVLVLCTFVSVVCPGSNIKIARLAEVAQHAVEQSKLTSPGSTPFHLKATILESTNPDSDYKAEIDEYWVSPDKLRRTITSPDFSQTLIVNGDKISEKDTGDYRPWWLNDLITAIFDPLPMLDSLKDTDATVPEPNGSGQSYSCGRIPTKVGSPPTENSAFYVFCFEGSRGLLKSADTPGYEAEFDNYREFKNKRVARRFVIRPEPGTAIEAKVTELRDLTNPDETLFDVQQSTPSKERMESIRVSEATIHKLSANTPDIAWPTVRDGKTSGVLSMYVSVDRSGHVRETWPLNSDNPRLDDSAREQVMKWQFKTATMHDAPVQTETVLTFAFNTKIADAVPVLPDADARKLATKVVEPVFSPGLAKGTEVKIQMFVTEDGAINSVTNPYSLSTPVFGAAYIAARQWHFRPYLRDGKPDVFKAEIVFRVP